MLAVKFIRLRLILLFDPRKPVACDVCIFAIGEPPEIGAQSGFVAYSTGFIPISQISRQLFLTPLLGFDRQFLRAFFGLPFQKRDLLGVQETGCFGPLFILPRGNRGAGAASENPVDPTRVEPQKRQVPLDIAAGIPAKIKRLLGAFGPGLRCIAQGLQTAFSHQDELALGIEVDVTLISVDRVRLAGLAPSPDIGQPVIICLGLNNGRIHQHHRLRGIAVNRHARLARSAHKGTPGARQIAAKEIGGVLRAADQDGDTLGNLDVTQTCRQELAISRVQFVARQNKHGLAGFRRKPSRHG